MIRSLRKPSESSHLTVKLKGCKVCKAKFVPRNSMARACSPGCAVLLAVSERVKQEAANKKQERKEDREKKRRLKTRGEWIAETQVVFNQYIRLRDQLAGHVCISSGKPLDWSGNNVDAGHYRSRGSAPHLRFDERNVHAQSKQENRYAAGNATDYRIGLIARIGLEAVEALEADQDSRDHSIEALKAIKAHYKNKLKQLQQGD